MIEGLVGNIVMSQPGIDNSNSIARVIGWSGYWLGGYLSITTGKWKWTDGSSFDFQNWKQGFNK